MSIFRKKQKQPLGDDSNSGSSLADLQEHPNSPPSAYEDGANKFAEIYGTAMVSSTRFFLISVVSLLLAIGTVVALVGLTPLKEVRPCVVEINPGTGVVNKPIEVTRITPNTAVIKAELARWAEALYTIDAYRTADLFKFANARSRDKAIGQFSEFRSREKVFERIRKEPGMVREVKVTSVDASQPGIAFVFLTAAERRSGTGGSAASKRYRLTLHYLLETATAEEQILANPIGIYVTFFNEIEEKAEQ